MTALALSIYGTIVAAAFAGTWWLLRLEDFPAPGVGGTGSDAGIRSRMVSTAPSATTSLPGLSAPISVGHGRAGEVRDPGTRRLTNRQRARSQRLWAEFHATEPIGRRPR